ncbi:MAG: ABC transporter substrate-binding protein, partial [Paracoccaceae bacterium]
RTEADPKKWASQYNFPAVQKGEVIIEQIPNGQPPSVTGIVFNLGREPLKDIRVRKAIALGFNFEWTNKSLLYDLFAQQQSFSDGSPLMSTGLPEGDELAFLQSLGDVVPAELLTTEPVIPHTSDEDRLTSRRNIRKAMKLLDEAGWEVGDDGVRRSADGTVLKIDFLRNSSGSATDKAVAENFVANLNTMGIKAIVEAVDPSQYTIRERDRDYDLVFDGYPALQGTGTGLAQRLGSETAAFSLFNPAGLASPMVDAIIEASLHSESQEEEDMMIRALDRALRYEFFVIPDGFKPDYWVAYFDQYGHPEVIPPYALGTLDFWWFEADKAAALKAAGVLR